MKMAKKLAAVLLAGVLALSVLTACSGSAGPLTKDNVTDYIIDYYKTNGYQAEEEQSMESAAQAVLAYVNSQIGKSEYNGMALREAFSAIIEDADEDTRKGWMSSVTLKDGYFYCVSCTSTEETYRTDLFNQGKTALVATTLVMDSKCGWVTAHKTKAIGCLGRWLFVYLSFFLASYSRRAVSASPDSG